MITQIIEDPYYNSIHNIHYSGVLLMYGHKYINKNINNRSIPLNLTGQCPMHNCTRVQNIIKRYIQIISINKTL